MDSWVLVIVPVFLADALLRALFVEWYYRMGVRAFSIKLDLPLPPRRRPTAGELQGALTSFFLGRTVLKEFSDGSFGFRRGLFGGSPLFHGLLEFDESPPRVRATAIASVGTCAFLVAWFAWALLLGGPGFAFLGIGICGLLVLIEYAEVSRVVKEAKHQCTRS